MKKAEEFYQRKRFGKQERVRKPHKWKVTHADGKVNHVVATDSMSAVKEARKLHTIAVQRVQDLGEETMKHVIVEKSQVQPFARVVMGKVQHVKGWLMPEKYKKEYTPTTRGVMDYVKDHIGIQGYTDIIKRSALESTYIMEGVQSAFLDVTNKGRGTFEKMAKTNPEGLKPFLGAIFNHVQEDVVALRRDLRKAHEQTATQLAFQDLVNRSPYRVGGRGPDKKPRKKRGQGYVKYTPENLLEESKPQSHREQVSSIRRILRGE
jgi:hypothetical protein